MSYKKLIFSALPAFALIATLSVGCKKSSSSPNSSSSISGTFGSSNFSANGATSSVGWYSTDSAVYILGGVALTGKDTSVLSVTIFPPFTLNTAITDTRMVNIDYYVSSTQDYWEGNGFGNVSLTVTSQDTVNHNIAGTFSGTLYNSFNNSDSIKVTNGKFNIPYNVVP